MFRGLISACVCALALLAVPVYWSTEFIRPFRVDKRLQLHML